MKSKFFLIVLILVMLFTLSAASPTPAPPEMIDLGTLGGNHSYGYAINDLGQITGNSQIKSGRWHVYLWENGVMKDLGAMGGYISYPSEININTQIAGSAFKPKSEKAYMWQEGELLKLSPSEISHATAINDLGQIVGFEMNTGFIWENGLMEYLGDVTPRDINNREQIVGGYRSSDGYTHGFLLDQGVFTDLGTLGGEFVQSYAQAINENGWIVGTNDTEAYINHAVLWRDGGLMDLGTLGGERSYAVDVNECGQIVGGSQTEDGTWHAFLWEDGVMIDLGDGAIQANGINNLGQVTGFRITESGDIHGFLWTGDADWIKHNLAKCQNQQ